MLLHDVMSKENSLGGVSRRVIVPLNTTINTLVLRLLLLLLLLSLLLLLPLLLLPVSYTHLTLPTIYSV